MNHRELIQSSRKKDRHAFLSLPEPLQDEIIDGLDSGDLTLQEASQRVKTAGYSLSHEAIASYLRAVRRERRLYDLNAEIPRLIEKFAAQPQAENLQALINLVIATATVGIADGSVGIKDVDLSKLLQAGRPASADAGRDAGATESAAPEKTEKTVTPELIEKIRKEVYGL